MNGSISLLLIHSPLTGPDVWHPVAETLRAHGAVAHVAELREDGAPGEPFWARHARSVAEALRALPGGERPLLVGHSGAGALLPLVREAGAEDLVHRLGHLYVYRSAHSLEKDRLAWELR
ncbi:MAG TPA: hypothetical protein VH916_03205, partial [Dehalococcoidia bacterium]